MVELAVASGKGGTGKTSLVGSFATVAESAILVDCDVDAANLHLIVEHSVLEGHDFSSSRRASIIEERCILCGICEIQCRFDAIRRRIGLMGETFQVDPLACEGCGLCKQICPADAVAFESVTSGQWFKSVSKTGPFFHAKLGIAEANSGKLVSLLRMQARDAAQQSDEALIIIDAPPGIGCPVIASITGVTYLFIVTEPSLSAIHDMQRLVELARHFKIRTGLCINKFDINPQLAEQIEQYGEINNLKIHGKIPFDKKFTEAQVLGKPYTAIASKENSATIESIWQSVQIELKAIKIKELNKKVV